jgi:hypothetical protein
MRRGDRNLCAPSQLRLQKKLSDVVLCINNGVANKPYFLISGVQGRVRTRVGRSLAGFQVSRLARPRHALARNAMFPDAPARAWELCFPGSGPLVQLGVQLAIPTRCTGLSETSRQPVARRLVAPPEAVVLGKKRRLPSPASADGTLVDPLHRPGRFVAEDDQLPGAVLFGAEVVARIGVCALYGNEPPWAALKARGFSARHCAHPCILGQAGPSARRSVSERLTGRATSAATAG